MQAYFITFRTYGTWLPGDARGWVDKFRNKYGTPPAPPDPEEEYESLRRLKHDLVILKPQGRDIVKRTIQEVCLYRRWPIHALNVRSNHVHMVLSAYQTPETVMIDLKAWCTRRIREAGVLADGVRPWSRHGSTIYLFSDEALEAACRYVIWHQDRDAPFRLR